MRKVDGKLLYSPSDLIRFMESPYSSWMDRAHLEDPSSLKPDEKTAEQELVAGKGIEHEQKFLGKLEAEQGEACRIEMKDPLAEQKTLEALKSGVPVVYQGCLAFENFRGFTDFLVRTRQHVNGGWEYEVWDTKLAKKAKPYYLVQLCCYAEMLEHILGIRPNMVRVVLGTGERASFRTAEFFDYYWQLKRAFLRMMDAFSISSGPPPPDPRADHGRWASHAEKWLRERDHLVQIAGISSGQIRRLEAAGCATVASLAQGTGLKVSKIAGSVLARLQEQARLQVMTREARAKDSKAPPIFQVLKPEAHEPRTGLALLPPPSEFDAFFDMEGFPLVENGLEYLWGVTYLQNGERQFVDWWAHDTAEEKAAFEAFIDWAYARWKADPSMHIYHYAAYEKSAVRRLAGRYATREDEVDDLLRNNVFVDLYQVVRQGLRVGEESYSIKKIELLYRAGRGTTVATAGDSIVQYAEWMESGQPRTWADSPILKAIRDYNRDDCDSTLELATWLRAQQVAHSLSFLALPRRAEEAPDPEAEAQLAQRRELVSQLREISTKGASDDERKMAALFVDLLEFYRREAKPMWWRYFERIEKTHEELKEDIDCIGDAQLTGDAPEKVKQSLVYTYRFDPTQETKRGAGDKVRPVSNPDVAFEITELSEEGVLRVKIGQRTLAGKLGGKMPARTSLIPDDTVTTRQLRDSLEAIVTAWVQRRTCPSALQRLLLRKAPDLPEAAAEGTPLLAQNEDVVAGAIRIVSSMRDSTLCLQGPPGTGKSFTAAKMIESLLRAGKRIGVMSNSHKAIVNLLAKVNENLGGRLQGIKVGGERDAVFFDSAPVFRWLEVSTGAADQYQGGVAAGTAWLFSRPEWAGRLDYLFIDEAGQVALANVIAVASATSNLVLLGDQMQLEQPVQGCHPGESGQSALNYYLDGHPTIPDPLGIFLPVTRRMHPDICRFVSDLVYEGRLQSAAGNERRSLNLGGRAAPLKPRGLQFLAVEHEGNVQSCDEEAEIIARLAAELLGADVTGTDGKVIGKIGWNDILFVAPYNLQVRNLRNRLPREARVGSVDKFQGQEAAIVFVSMCSSFGEYGSRGLQFILDQNRMNVAISRAQVLAVVVGDPRISISPASSIDEMRRINLYCRLTSSSS